MVTTNYSERTNLSDCSTTEKRLNLPDSSEELTVLSRYTVMKWSLKETIHSQIDSVIINSPRVSLNAFVPSVEYKS